MNLPTGFFLLPSELIPRCFGELPAIAFVFPASKESGEMGSISLVFVPEASLRLLWINSTLRIVLPGDRFFERSIKCFVFRNQFLGDVGFGVDEVGGLIPISDEVIKLILTFLTDNLIAVSS